MIECRYLPSTTKGNEAARAEDKGSERQLSSAARFESELGGAHYAREEVS